MKRLISLTIFSFILSYSFGQFTAIDSLFAAWNQPNVPGCALGIFKDGEIMYARGYGLANMEYEIPNTDSTVFRIGSTSKQFTAACIILLAEQGKLHPDTDLKSIYPDFPAYAEKITIRHLLNHTSGIRDYLTLSYLKGFHNDDYYEDKDVMNWLISQSELNFEPGTAYLYSNSGYWLLGQIVEKISGKNMADFAKDEIFEPLGMSHTHFHNDHKKIVKNRASGYEPNAEGGYSISMTTLDMIGDGGIFTTIKDIKKWDDAFYNSSVLSKKFWETMTLPGVLNNGEKIEYAAGLVNGNYKGLKTIRHGGAFVGFRADVLRFPDQQLSIAIFANRADANPSQLANQVADILLKDKFENYEYTTQNGANAAGKNSFINLKESDLKKYSGNYWNPSDFYARKIYVKNDTLRYYRNEYSESTLLPISKNEFKMVGVNADVLVKFDAKNAETMTLIIDGGKPDVFNKFEPKKYKEEDLDHFEGSYYSKELDVIYKIQLDDGIMNLYVNGDKKAPFESIKENVFQNDAIGIFLFDQNPDGQISGFRLAAGRVKNLLFEKE